MNNIREKIMAIARDKYGYLTTARGLRIMEALSAAADIAATALAEAGYDAVEVFRALPELLEDWRCKITMLDSVASRVVTKESHDLLRRIKGE